MKIAIAALLCCEYLSASGPEIGIWKLDLAKSKFSPGPPPQRRILRIEPAGEGLRYTREDVTFDGKLSTGGDVVRLDGKDYPQTAIPTADTISSLRIDTHTVQHAFKKGGAVAYTMQDVLSADGKILTRRTQGINGRRQRVSNLMVFEKLSDQPALEIGFWKLNISKSRSSTGPLTRSWMLHIEPDSGAYRVTRESVCVKGKRVAIVRLDGKDYPQTIVPGADTVSSVRRDTFTTEHFLKKAGVVIARMRDVISSDAKVLTHTSTLVTGTGQQPYNLWVFERDGAN